MGKRFTRLLAAGAMVGLGAVHFLPKNLLPFGSRTVTSALIVGALLVVHRNPMKMLARDTARLLESGKKSQAKQMGTKAPVIPS